MEQTMQRRQQSRRRQTERRRWKLARGLLAAAAMLLAASVFFQITDIQVRGNVLYSEGEVLEASGLRPGRSAFTVSGWLTERRIRKALPGVSQAEVSLSVPDTLIITVEETPAIAALDTGSGIVLLSRDCQVVSGFQGDQALLIRVRGISPVAAEVGQTLGVSDGESTKLSYLQELMALLDEEEMLADVQDIDISNVSNLCFTYEGRFTVRLGEAEKLSSKLDLLRRVVQTLNAGDSGILDLSTGREGHYIPG